MAEQAWKLGEKKISYAFPELSLILCRPAIT